MSKQTINIGASPNDGTGTPLRTSFDYTNQNFTEIYTALGGGVALPGATTQVIFNDGGTNLAGDAGLVYNKTTDALTVAGLVTAGSATITGALTVDTSTLVVDATNDRVGIGTATPSQPLHVKLDQNAYTFSRVDNQNASSGAYASLMLAASGNTWGIGVGSTAANSNALDFFLDAGGANSVKMTLNTAGNLAFPTGKGIDFTATANSSGTMTSELLNDYEEGTFTPTMLGTTLAGVGVYGTQSGSYTKIGNLVTVSVYFDWTSHTATGNMRLGGLPFATNATANSISSVSFGYVNNVALTASNILTGFTSTGNTFIDLYQTPTGGGTSTLVPVDTNCAIGYNVSYRV